MAKDPDYLMRKMILNIKVYTALRVQYERLCASAKIDDQEIATALTPIFSALKADIETANTLIEKRGYEPLSSIILDLSTRTKRLVCQMEVLACQEYP